MSRVPEVLPSVHVAVPAMTKFDRAMLERAGTNLRAVIQFGVGVEGVDFACASERGIAVANIPSDAVPLNPNAASCAEMAVRPLHYYYCCGGNGLTPSRPSSGTTTRCTSPWVAF